MHFNLGLILFSFVSLLLNSNMMSKPKAKGNKTSFNNKGENETTAYTKKYNQLVQI